MIVQSRIVDIGDRLRSAHQIALASGESDPFERLLDRIEMSISTYLEYRRKQDE